MPLTSIRLRNFKCFADSGRVPLAPLTVIFGRNNVGKSTILQSLFLVRQTLDNPDYGPRLRLDGALYPAGGFVDLVHQHRSKQTITMEVGVEIPERSLDGQLELAFGSQEPDAPKLTHLRIESRNHVVEVTRAVGRGGPYSMSIDRKPIGKERDANFFFPVNRLLPLIGPEPARVGRPSASREEARRVARTLIEHFEATVRTIRAVGAFRRHPERRYELRGRVPVAIDLTGEHAVVALIEDAVRRRAGGALFENVNRWLKEVGRVRLLSFRRRSTAPTRLFEVRLRDTDSGRWANFADVGFGIGQAFPVLVEGLRTPPGGLFVVQEPEIHLHPDAQLTMGDFLVDLVRSGRRVIAETHSEALLLRIRHAIVSTGGNGRSRPRLKTSDVSIIHVDKKSDGTSNARRLEIDELGQIKNWPRNFLEDVTTERLAVMKDMLRRSDSSK